ncbi:MAG TPA: homoserine dehydrogenase [Planctomycetota bacterium]
MLLADLRAREARGEPIRVALLGCGAMGVGIAWQLARTPGMELVAIADLRQQAVGAAAAAYGGPVARVAPGGAAPAAGTLWASQAPDWLADLEFPIDVLVEATNTIGFAGASCLQAIERGMHVVLMNAEVDLLLGPLLHQRAAARGVVVGSDAGDQHGVLLRMHEEMQLWGFELAMAGNIKGFLDRYATAEGLVAEARKRQLDPLQCCAYTDGTKLGIEMALVANATGAVPAVPGMHGPRAAHVTEVFDRFDFDALPAGGVVDYLLGAEPGGGVFLVGRCEDPLQLRYLQYYKVQARGPFHLLYRPYHLCHLETPRAIALAVVHGQAVLAPDHGRVADVYAVAKRELRAGESVAEGIGGSAFYGRIERCAEADAAGHVPIALLEPEGAAKALLHSDLARDQALTAADVALPASTASRLFAEQSAWLAAAAPRRR